MIKKYKEEYNNLTKNIINNEHFLMTKNDMHHGRTKYEHLVRVSKCAFVMSKIFKADTITCTTAGLLHDLFYGERTDSIENSYLNHPHTARNNAIKYFGVGDKVACAIETHMFHHVILKKIFPFTNDSAYFRFVHLNNNIVEKLKLNTFLFSKKLKKIMLQVS